MSVYKELLLAAHEVESNSTQIYPDAADFGVRIESSDNKYIKTIKSLLELYDGKVETIKCEAGATQNITFEYYDEFEPNIKKRKILRTLKFSYHHINKKLRRRNDPMGILTVCYPK
jgi:hypothetical protein